MAKLPPGVGRRLMNGAAANFVDKLALLVVQLVSIPLLSHAWGAEGYGTWLMLMTIPTYISVSDFGVSTAAGVEMTRRVAKNDLAGALETFQSAWAFVGAILVAIGLLAATYATLSVLGSSDGVDRLPIAAFLVTLYALAAVQMTILAVVYRATHKYAHAMLISAVVIVCEGVALVITVTTGGDLVAAAIAILAVRIAGLLVTFLVLRRMEPWVRLGFSHARLSTVKRLSRPSLAALALTMSAALSLQGMVLAVGWAAGPAGAAVFGATRFLARIPLQFSGLLMRASIPELTRAQVAGDGPLTRRLTLMNVASALVPTLPLVPLLALAGPALLLLISGGELHGPWWLFLLLTLTTMFGAVWQALASPLIAANQQSRFAYGYAALSLLAIAAVIFASVPALLTAAAAALVVELAVMVIIANIQRLNRPLIQ